MHTKPDVSNSKTLIPGFTNGTPSLPATTTSPRSSASTSPTTTATRSQRSSVSSLSSNPSLSSLPKSHGASSRTGKPSFTSALPVVPGHRLPWLRSAVSHLPIAFPEDFRSPPARPESHYVDAIGMVIPGTSDRTPCQLQKSHFVTSWQLGAMIEYSTVLADHGITWADWRRLGVVLDGFLRGCERNLFRGKSPVVERSNEDGGTRLHGTQAAKTVEEGKPAETDTIGSYLTGHRSKDDEKLRVKEVQEQFDALNALLEGITNNLQHRGVPISLSLSSASVLPVRQLHTAHIQLLHKPLSSTTTLHRRHHSICTISGLFGNQCRVSVPVWKLQEQKGPRANPWPMNPENMPLHKRMLVQAYPEKYGADPYFREAVRENVMIGGREVKNLAENVNEKGLFNTTSDGKDQKITYMKRTSMLGFFRNWVKLRCPKRAWYASKASIVNKAAYTHNRALEVRRNVEQGYRLRLARFSFRDPIWLPYTPEMPELGLTRGAYIDTLHRIEEFRLEAKASKKHCSHGCLHFQSPLCRGTSKDAVHKVMDFIKQVNVECQRLGANVVWTMEEIPCVKGVLGGQSEWEISIWDQSDALELLKELEGWGLVGTKFWEGGEMWSKERRGRDLAHCWRT